VKFVDVERSERRGEAGEITAWKGGGFVSLASKPFSSSAFSINLLHTFKSTTVMQ
jgi:hypothetical protein